MTDRPEIEPGDWIQVGSRDCVVANVREAGNSLGDCEVVFNSSKPTNCDVLWDGEKWAFVSSDLGGYADRYEHLNDAVWTLKRGRWAR